MHKQLTARVAELEQRMRSLRPVRAGPELTFTDVWAMAAKIKLQVARDKSAEEVMTQEQTLTSLERELEVKKREMRRASNGREFDRYFVTPAVQMETQLIEKRIAKIRELRV